LPAQGQRDNFPKESHGCGGWVSGWRVSRNEHDSTRGLAAQILRDSCTGRILPA
jgi:hypothetical protein